MRKQTSGKVKKTKRIKKETDGFRKEIEGIPGERKALYSYIDHTHKKKNGVAKLYFRRSAVIIKKVRLFLGLPVAVLRLGFPVALIEQQQVFLILPRLRAESCLILRQCNGRLSYSKTFACSFIEVNIEMSKHA